MKPITAMWILSPRRTRNWFSVTCVRSTASSLKPMSAAIWYVLKRLPLLKQCMALFVAIVGTVPSHLGCAKSADWDKSTMQVEVCSGMFLGITAKMFNKLRSRGDRGP